MEYKKEMLETYNLHTVYTDNFKECRFEINFRENVTKDNYLKCIFLNDILTYSTKNNPRRKDMVIKSEELYQVQIYGNTTRLGKAVNLSIGCNFINPEYAKEDNYLEDVIEFVTDIIFNPNIKDNRFDETSFNIVKNDLISNFETLKESPMRVASFNAFNMLEDNSATKIFLDNYTKDDILDITSEDIYNFYKEVLEHFICDVIIVGDLKFDKISKLVQKYIKLRTIKNHKVDLYEENLQRKKVLMKKDVSTFNQTTLLLAYNLIDLTDKERIYVMHIFDYIFCNGGFKSKLFKSLREDNSLCYGVSSFYMKFDKMYGLKVSLAKENVKKAIKLIDKSLKEMNVASFEDDLIDEAKKSILNTLKTSNDAIYSFTNECFLREIDGFPPITERMKAYRKITKEEIANVSKKLKANLIYVLEDGAR